MGVSHSDGIDWKVGAFYVTRDGRKMECLKINLITDDKYAIVGILTNTDGFQIVHTWTKDGQFIIEVPRIPLDIVGPWVEPKRKRIVYEWMTLTNGVWWVERRLHTEEEAARRYALHKHQKTGRQFEVEE